MSELKLATARKEELPAIIRVMESNYKNVAAVLTELGERIDAAKRHQKSQPGRVATTVVAHRGSDESDSDYEESEPLAEVTRGLSGVNLASISSDENINGSWREASELTDLNFSNQAKLPEDDSTIPSSGYEGSSAVAWSTCGLIADWDPADDE